MNAGNAVSPVWHKPVPRHQQQQEEEADQDVRESDEHRCDLVGFFDEQFGAGSAISSAEDTDFIFRAYLTVIRSE